MILDYLLLPMFFLIGLVTSYEDIRYGKIRNKWIVFGASWGATIYLLILGWNLTRFFIPKFSLPFFETPFSFLGKTLINALAALLFGFLVWRAKGWAAGDAKLFFVFSLLIPINFYWKSYLPFFPSFALLINIFIPLLLFLFFRSCLHFLKFIYLNFYKFKAKGLFEISKKILGDKKSLKSQALMMMGFLGIFLVIGLFQKKIETFFSINVSSLPMILFPALVIFSGFISKFFEKTTIVKITVIIFGLLLGYGFIFNPSLTARVLFQSVQTMVIFMVALSLFRKLIDFYVEYEQKQGKRTFPMAVWIFSGGLLTLILKGSILAIIFKMV